jgi:hypothetical protein
LGKRHAIFRAHLSSLGMKLISAGIPIAVTAMMLHYYGLSFTMTLLMRFALIIVPAVALLAMLDYRRSPRKGNTEVISVHEFGFLHRRKDVFTAYLWSDIDSVEPIHFPTGYGHYVENAIIGYRVNPTADRNPLIINKRFQDWRSLSHTMMIHHRAQQKMRHFRPRTRAWHRRCDRLPKR